VASWNSAGTDLTFVLATGCEAGIDGRPPQEAGPVREVEQRNSAKIVGVGTVEFLGHRDGEIEYGRALRDDVARAIRRHRPELLVAYNHHDLTYTGKWNIADHRHTGRAVLDAVSVAANRWQAADDAGDEAWGGVKYVAVAASPAPTHAVDVSGTLDLGVASVEAHEAYLAGLGLPPGAAKPALEAYAKAMGERFDGRPAVAFEMLEV
jgi:LmbE family N-acetylglucosaminyl deacetylase